MERWNGKVAVVTGASSGIGEALVENLVRQGLQVAGLARRVERIEENAKKLEGCKGKLHAFYCDMTDDATIIEAFKKIVNTLGPIHILVNNAGITKDGTLIKGNEQVWRQTMDTNVMGLCLATREAVNSMLENNIDGHVIHINSIVGHKMLPLNMYSPSKYALTCITEVMRQELNQLKSKIKVSSVSPGFTETELDGAQNMPKDAPRLMPTDIVNAIVFVLSTPPHVQVHELIIKPVGEIY
ncbi:PREDICTED: farnesol dehydrogenase-like [Nicrophorus vespilloides]|uniref:Farnesol dehydrogenase-like n=1 Tax=Nicrophorus vespilloides TaxID=110193 RepID=A0ABM1N2G5_NICVS|nr:PREDICTED: farnesol dehydrogenase-like [Nicrophorus vespilloides]